MDKQEDTFFQRMREALEAHEVVRTKDDLIELARMTMERLKAYERAEDQATTLALEARS
jgi:hypothetical protein